MPEYLAPGVYVEEVDLGGGKPIEGVSTTTAAFIGEAERGPTEVRFITGVEQYRRVFGGLTWRTGDGARLEDSSSTLAYAVDGFFANGGKRCFIARVTGEGGTPAKRVFDGVDIQQAPVQEPIKTDPVLQQSGDEVKPDTKKTAQQPKSNPPSGTKVTITACGPGSWGNRVFVQVGESLLAGVKPGLFRLTVSYQDRNKVPVMQEDYNDLVLDPESPSFIERRINGISSLIVVTVENAGGTLPQDTEAKPLANGTDAKPKLGDYDGVDPDPGKRRGLAALEQVDEISIIAAPDGYSIDGLSKRLVEHCEKLRDRFAILCGKPEDKQPDKLFPRDATGDRIDSQYAAFYAPHIKIVDPVSGRIRPIPAVGHVAGVYARSDIERGVFKAPANEVLRGAVGLEPSFSQADQEMLNPVGVNVIRAMPGRGIRVWGARTTSSDPNWKYVNVRRLFLFVEESIEQGTQWVVFEPNDQRLWARVRQSVSDFLMTVWRSGALMGLTPEQAFFVKCDETTMTQNDIMTGRLIVLIGIAPVRPAEFVIFRIAQWTQNASQ